MNGFGDISEQICRSGVSDLHQQQKLMLQFEQRHRQVIFFPFWGCNGSGPYANHKQVTAK